MSCTSPLTVASTIVPLAVEPPSSSMNGSRNFTAAFIALSRLQDERKLHLPAAKRSPTAFMPSSRMLLMMSSGGYFLKRLLERVFEPDLLTVDDVMFEALLDRQVRMSSLSTERIFPPSNSVVNSVSGS